MHAQILHAVILMGPTGSLGLPLAQFHFESHATAFRDALNKRWVELAGNADPSNDASPDLELFAEQHRIPLTVLRSKQTALSDYSFATVELSVAATLDDALAASHVAEPALDDAHQSLIRDAHRWRALMSSQRFKLMGSAGFDYQKIDEANDRTFANLRAIPEKEHLHFGIEVWNIHAAHNDPRYPDRFERELLTAYVDTLVARRKTPL